jgi:hypothetical protein
MKLYFFQFSLKKAGYLLTSFFFSIKHLLRRTLVRSGILLSHNREVTKHKTKTRKAFST